MLDFSCDVVKAVSAVFYWIDQDTVAEKFHRKAITLDVTRVYTNRIRPVDPYRPDRLVRKNKRIGITNLDADIGSSYLRFLASFGRTSEATMLLMDQGETYAVLALFSDASSDQFSETFNWEAMRKHMEFSLQHHPELVDRRASKALQARYGLTAREIQVLKCISRGSDNTTLSSQLNISVATVKSHLFNIYNKMGVDNRSSAVALGFHPS